MNFKECGFEEQLLIANVSFHVWLFLFHFASIFFLVLPIILLSRCCSGKLSCVKTKLTKYFFWNGMIRLFMETFLDFFLSAVLNVYIAVWKSPYYSENYSNIVSLIFLSFTAAFIIAFLCCSLKNFTRLKQASI